MHDARPTRFDVPARPRPFGSAGVARPSAIPSALRRILIGVLVEACRYACGSPRSRLHQRAALRELDDRLRQDIGAAPPPQDQASARASDRVAQGHSHARFKGRME